MNMFGSLKIEDEFAAGERIFSTENEGNENEEKVMDDL